jgi:hypothetical protein
LPHCGNYLKRFAPQNAALGRNPRFFAKQKYSYHMTLSVIVLLPKKHQCKIGDKCVVLIKGIMPTPWGDLDAIRGRQQRTPQPRKGIGGVRSSHGAGPHSGQATGPERGSAEPRKARFFAQQKMRPNEILK